MWPSSRAAEFHYFAPDAVEFHDARKLNVFQRKPESLPVAPIPQFCLRVEVGRFSAGASDDAILVIKSIKIALWHNAGR